MIGPTLVMGASTNPFRFSYKLIERLSTKGHKVYGIGKRTGNIFGVDIMSGMPDLEQIHTISLYLNPKNQEEYYDYFLKLAPDRVIFNPGTYNPVLKKLLNNNGIRTVEECSLVLLSMNEYETR